MRNRVGGNGYVDQQPMLRTPVSHLPEPRVGQGTQGRARALLDALKAVDGLDDPWIWREYREDEDGNPIPGQMFRKDDGRRAPTIDPEVEALRREKIRKALAGRKRPRDVVERILRTKRAKAIRRARAAEPTRLSNYRTLRLDLGERVDTTFVEDE